MVFGIENRVFEFVYLVVNFILRNYANTQESLSQERPI